MFRAKLFRRIDFFVPLKVNSGNSQKKKAEFIKAFREQSKVRKTLATGDLRVKITFFFTTEAKIDIDNLLKTALDAMNGVIYPDDSQIKRIQAEIIEFSAMEGAWIIVDRAGYSPY